MISVRYRDPTVRTFEESLLGWLLTELPDASSLRFASGYFESSILDWLEEPFESLQQRGGFIQALVGSNGGGTGRADLERLLSVLDATSPDSSLHVEYAEGGIFHPKVFLVEAPSRVAALIGSANLTANGSIVNVEAGIVIESDQPGSPAEEPLDAVIESIDPSGRQDAFRVESISDLDELEKAGIIGRIVQTSPTTNERTAESQRRRRRAVGVRTRPGVSGVPAKTRKPSPKTAPAAAPTAVAAATQREFYGLQFSANDLKDTGTREISVSSSFRAWAEDVLGRALVPGEGKLFDVIIDGRLAASPLSVSRTQEPVRLWVAGGSGGTHQDVRLVLGQRFKADLDDEAVQIVGTRVPPKSIRVFELPDDPQQEPVRLTIFMPSDPDYAAVEAHLGRTGREQKQHFRVTQLPQVPSWP